MIRGLIKKLLREALDTDHALKRVSNRILKMNNVDIDSDRKDRILTNLELVKEFKFTSYESFIIFLGDFKPNPKSTLYVKIDDKGYYKIVDIVTNKDSTGDQIWAIVRNNEIKTVMLKKHTQTKNEKQIEFGNNVNNVIWNIDKYIKGKGKENPKPKKPTKRELRLLAKQKKEKERQRQQRKESIIRAINEAFQRHKLI